MNYLHIGLITREKKYPRQWNEVKEEIVTGIESNALFENKLNRHLMPGEKRSLKSIKDTRSLKFLGCIEYIKYCARVYADTCPTDGNVRFVPYENPTQFYQDYVNFHDTFGLGINTKAKSDTFRKALDSLYDSIRLVHAKGSFPTCDTCNNANDMLRNPKVSFNPEFRDIVMKFKRAHLMRQMEERAYMEENIHRAKSEVKGHQPQVAHLLCDAISSWRGNTPKVGGGQYRHSKGDQNFVENRVMAVEMVCGPINCVRLYHSNNLVSSGANYMITVLKQALEDLAQMCFDEGFVLPPELILNFDNCGENKNQFMFAYCSILVELCLFKVIQVNFLIVGHTHCSVDRMFGTFSDRINACKFIASPHALRHLLVTSIHDRAVFNMEIISVYDWKSFLQPYINPKIKYYGIPHNFRISLKYHKAVFQYRLYSTFKWLPVEPWKKIESIAELDSLELTEVHLRQFCVVGDEATLLSTIGAESISTDKLVNDPQKLKVISTYSAHKEVLTALESNAIHQQIQRHQDECDGYCDLEGRSRYTTNPQQGKAMLLEIMKKRNTDQAGYMWWIIEPDNLPSYTRCAPELVYTRDMVKAVAQSALSRADIVEAIIDISLDDEVLQRPSNSDTAKSKLKKATLLNLRNKASIITTAARSFLKNAQPAASGGNERFILNPDLGNRYCVVCSSCMY
jgi:hypothetical protein